MNPKLSEVNYVYRGKLVEVQDGDTVKIEIDLGFYTKITHQFRLLGVNTPETKGPEKPLGRQAKTFVQNLLEWSPTVVVKAYKADSFGRWLAEIYLLDGRCLNDIIVEKGYGVRWDGSGARPTFDPSAPFPLAPSAS